MRHLWQRLIEAVLIFLVLFVLDASIAKHLLLVHHVTANSLQHVAQSLRHLCALFSQSRVDALHLLRHREAIVARDDLCHQVAVEAADMAEIDSKLESQDITVGRNRLLAFIIQLPPLPEAAVVCSACSVFFTVVALLPLFVLFVVIIS